MIRLWATTHCVDLPRYGYVVRRSFPGRKRVIRLSLDGLSRGRLSTRKGLPGGRFLSAKGICFCDAQNAAAPRLFFVMAAVEYAGNMILRPSLR